MAPTTALFSAPPGVLEIPTAGVPMEPLAVQVGQVVKRLSALPLEQVANGLDSLISAARRIVEDPLLRAARPFSGHLGRHFSS